MMSRRDVRPAAGWIALALVLNGCAGGGGHGGGGSTSVTTPPPVTNSTTPSPAPPSPTSSADSFRTSEYLRMGALDAIHAADAYALGYTGKGVIIGIVDFNFDLGSSEVSYTSGSRGPNATMQALYQAQTGQAQITDQHGHAVAATAAALKNDIGVQGVAFDAQVLGVDFFSDVNETQVSQGGVLYHVSDPWTYITTHGSRIINTSFGYEAGSGSGGVPGNIHEAYVLQSAAQALLNGALLVSSAGNGSGSHPSQSNLDTLTDMTDAGIINASGAYIDNAGGGFIIAGAVDSNNQIAFFSDRAGNGIAKNFYLVAPGVNLVLPWNGSSAIVSGTSFSAPLISGAAAILFQRWPTLSARDVATILFTTATDLGAPGIDSVYGNGLLNLQAALQPVGTTSFATMGGTSGTAVMGSGIVLSNAFGDAPALHAALTNVTMLDAFNRDFQTDASLLVAARPSLPDRFAALEQKFAWHGASYQVGADTQFTYNVRSNTEDALLPLRSAFGPQEEPVHQAMFQFSGVGSGYNWTAGSGLALDDALSAQSATDPFSAMALTEAFHPALAAPGMFASARVALDSETGLAAGFANSQNQGITDHLRTPFRNNAQSAAMKLDHAVAGGHIALELGDTLEHGGLFGSLAAGGLKMSDSTSTAWTTLSADAPLSAHWLIRSAFTVAASGATHPGTSLISEIGPVYATSFSFGVGGTSIFRDGDALSFTLDQPLRAERGAVTLITGLGRDPNSGALLMQQAHASLVPSGREIAFESGYRFSLGEWNAGANVAFAHDADNISGRDDVTGLLWFSRAF